MENPTHSFKETNLVFRERKKESTFVKFYFVRGKLF